jgi:flagellar biosynthesis protein FlgN
LPEGRGNYVDHLSTSLIAVLNEQIRCAEAMLGTLGRENQALIDGDPELLNAAGADKARLVAELETLETERRALSEAVEASVGSRASSSESSWHTLLELVAACKEQNQRNGALVKARSDQVRMALKALRGSNEPECYNPTGLQSAARGARRLGSA